MTITIGSFSTNALTVQPFGYDGDARYGLTARQFEVGGLLTAAQWQALISVYNTWRDNRIADQDTLASKAVGSTVSLSITATNGLSVTSLACWFTEAPQGTQAGNYVDARVVLVDAAQALATLLREEERRKEREEEAETPDLGTLAVGSAVVTLTAPMETRQDGPQVALTATGNSYVTGALKAHKIRNVRGRITTGTPDQILSWFDTTIATEPAVGVWFPISAPIFTAEAKIVSGAKVTQYSVELTQLQIL
jgi:hypothetical protein